MTNWIAVVEDAVKPVGQRPVYLVRRDFSLVDVPESASLRISAHGIYTAFINGTRVGNDELTPGYTDYNFRTQFQTYQVADLLRSGHNAIVVELADGWYRGSVGIMQTGDQYGSSVELWAELVSDLNGGEVIVSTDEPWASRPSHILAADMFRGQVEDLRLKNSDWYLAVTQTTGWIPTRAASYAGELFPQVVEPNRVVEYLPPVSIVRLGPTTQVVDFGQNSNGWVRLSKLGKAGTEITLTCGEWRDSQGDVTLDHLSVNFPIFPNPIECHQVDSVISDGNPDSVLEPRYVTHGFQFVRVEGLEEDLTPADIAAAVVHTDLKRIGHFRSSDDRLNWLHNAAVWSFRGNACDIPTDCPTRERMGWTGDWQLYAETAAFLYDVREFNRKYLHDVRLIQQPNGKVLNIAPMEKVSITGIPGNSNGSAGWGDVISHAPMMIYREYADITQLDENYEAITRWIDFGLSSAKSGRHHSREDQPKKANEDFLWDTTFHWGEWLEPDNSEADFEAFLRADKAIVSNAYLFRTCGETAEIAQILGKPESEIDRYRQIAANVLKAWQDEYLSIDGKLSQPTQANYARALAFGMIPASLVATAAAELANLIVQNGNRLSTGFLATPLLLPVLSDHGYSDLAYKLLFQDEQPSWLAMRNRGATTIWEQWGGVDAAGNAHESLNHYSKGAVINFLHQYTAGLKPLEPGYRHFAVKPVPTPGLEWVELSLDSPAGLIRVGWMQSGTAFELKVSVPAAATALVTLPNGIEQSLGSGEHNLSCSI